MFENDPQPEERKAQPLQIQDIESSPWLIHSWFEKQMDLDNVEV